MNKGPIKYALLLAIAAVAFGCNRDDDEPVGGKGGNATLRVTPMHHSANIDSSKVYIKYNASDIPSSYDDSIMCVMVGGKPVAIFTGLKKGKYYLFGKGYDPGVPASTTEWFNVKGGMSYEIKDEVVLEPILPVSEVH